jgi:hypothetical protein
MCATTGTAGKKGTENVPRLHELGTLSGSDE